MTNRFTVWLLLGLEVLALLILASCSRTEDTTEILPSQLRPEIGQHWVGLRGGLAGERFFHLVKVDGSEFITLTSEHGIPMSFAISPDQSQVAYVCAGEPDDLCLMDIETGQEKVLVDLSQQMPDAVAAFEPTFSPDGRQVVFTGGFPDAIGLFVVNTDGTDLQQIREGLYSNRASYSPDGQQIVFECEGEQGIPTQICVMNADGTEQKRLTSSKLRYGQAQFTPDGHFIVFSAHKIQFLLDMFGWGDSGQLYIMEADGSDLRTLFPDKSVGIMAFSTDGQEFVYQTVDQETGELEGIYVAHIDGTNRRRIGDDWWDVARKGGGLE